jgi:hypothetical protein
MEDKINDMMEKVKNTSYSAAMTVGVDEKGQFVAHSTIGNLAVMHWMLNKSIFELMLSERAADTMGAQNTEENAEEKEADSE